MNTSRIKIMDIIKNHWDDFKKYKGNKLPKDIRNDIYESVEKAIYCGDTSKGYAQYICLNCGNTHKVGFSCKSKACIKCGIKYSVDWAEKQLHRTLNVKHSHITFTIPLELRVYFYKDRELLKEMHKAVYNCVKYYYTKKCIGNYIPGIITVLHTFGDDLKFNPHIHTIITEGGIDKNEKWFNELEHIPYSYLRKSWQKLILDLLNKSKFKVKSLVNKMYKNYPKGFYVNVEKSIKNIKHTIKYLGRYLSRVPISNSRIINYDGKNITYSYKEKTTRKKFFITVNVLDFIGKLVQHINKKHFKSIRRYGLYSRRLNKLSINIINLFNFVEQRNISDLLSKLNFKNLNFRERLIKLFNIDIKQCKVCNQNMKLFRIWSLKSGLIYDMKFTFKNIIKNQTKQNLIFLRKEQLVLF